VQYLSRDFKVGLGHDVWYTFGAWRCAAQVWRFNTFPCQFWGGAILHRLYILRVGERPKPNLGIRWRFQHMLQVLETLLPSKTTAAQNPNLGKISKYLTPFVVKIWGEADRNV